MFAKFLLQRFSNQAAFGNHKNLCLSMPPLMPLLSSKSPKNYITVMNINLNPSHKPLTILKHIRLIFNRENPSKKNEIIISINIIGGDVK